jgi:hypothetical protein
MNTDNLPPQLRRLGQRTRFIGQLESILLSLCGVALIGAIVLLMPGGIKLQAPGNAPAAQSPAAADAIDRHRAGNAGPVGRHREGFELVEQIGVFRLAGDRIVFYSEDGRLRLVVLENLALARVANVLATNPEPMRWKVTGTLTEYRNTNYLLLRRVELLAPEQPTSDSGQLPTGTNPFPGRS